MGIHTRTARVVGLAAVIVLASCSLGWAQPAAADPSFERMRAKLKAGDRLTVDLMNGAKVEGRVIDGSPDGLVISTSGGDRRLSRPDIGIVRRHATASFSELITYGVGLVRCGDGSGSPTKGTIPMDPCSGSPCWASASESASTPS